MCKACCNRGTANQHPRVLGLTSAGYRRRRTRVKAGLLVERPTSPQWTGAGISVNAWPGYFRVQMTDSSRVDTSSRDLPRTMEGRLAKPTELSAALIFLASDASSYVTGTVPLTAAS